MESKDHIRKNRWQEVLDCCACCGISKNYLKSIKDWSSGIKYSLDYVSKIFICMVLLFRYVSMETTLSTFPGAEHWSEDYLQQCDSPPPLNQSLSCYSYVLHYQRLNTEVISEDPFLIIYRGFASQQNLNNFLNDIKDMSLTKQRVISIDDSEVVVEDHSSRQANGTYIAHQGSQGVAKMFTRILSYQPGGHYAPHYDYINYTSSSKWDWWQENLGNRFATFLLVLEAADKGGG